MRNKKPMADFGETHPDEISSLQFFKGKANKLMTASIDGMVCQFDLKKDSEEEATETSNKSMNCLSE
jgi:peroxiredoxin